MAIEQPHSLEIVAALRVQLEQLRKLGALYPSDAFYLKSAEQLAAIIRGLEQREPTTQI